MERNQDIEKPRKGHKREKRVGGFGRIWEDLEVIFGL